MKIRCLFYASEGGGKLQANPPDVLIVAYPRYEQEG